MKIKLNENLKYHFETDTQKLQSLQWKKDIVIEYTTSSTETIYKAQIRQRDSWIGTTNGIAPKRIKQVAASFTWQSHSPYRHVLTLLLTYFLVDAINNDY